MKVSLRGVHPTPIFSAADQEEAIIVQFALREVVQQLTPDHLHDDGAHALAVFLTTESPISDRVPHIQAIDACKAVG